MSVKKIYSFPLIILLVLFMLPALSVAQIIQPTGKFTETSSQLVYYYDTDDSDSTIMVTNTNDTTAVWIHVQIFRSFNPDNGDNSDSGDADVLPNIICDERNFVDLLTPNDTHVYDLDEENFPKNMGESEGAVGESTSLTDQLSDTLGFVVITPVVSEADLTAISFEYLMGNTFDDDEDFVINAMGRDAVDFTNGSTVPDGTPLDGVTNGFVVLQPSEFQFNFGTDEFGGDIESAEINIVGIAFFDQYGDPGLLGYQVLPGSVNWTSFLFDYKEDPTSCGNRPVECFLNIGLNDRIPEFNEELTSDLLCSGATTPEFPFEGLGNDGHELEIFGWGRIFVFGQDTLENHLALVRFDEDAGDHPEGADWMHTK